MTAKEMFEEMGYRIWGKTDSNLKYAKKIDIEVEQYIDIDLKSKMFCKYKKRISECRELFITLEEFKAIQKQIEELGW